MRLQIRTKNRFAQIVFVLLLLATGCASRQEMPTITPTSVPTTIRTSTKTPEPTSTFLPTQTEIFAGREIVIPTIVPTLASNLNQATIYTVGFLEDWRYFFTLEAPSQVEGKYYAIVQKNKRYDCFTLPRYPNRLYCFGPLVDLDDYVTLTVFDLITDRPVYFGKAYIPMYQRGSSAP